MIFVRGAREDFDDWRAAGNPGWGFDDVLPFFRKLETHESGDGPWHGDQGPIHVTPMRPGIHAVSKAFLEGCRELQLPENPDFNGERIEGAGVYDVNTRAGLRSSSSREYLHPARRRPNLRILHHTQVDHLLWRDGRIDGVTARRGGEAVMFRARSEVILCGGAFASPKLLQLSGIGDGAHLGAIGVEARRHLPAVGRNLQDHVCASFYYRSRVPTLNAAFGHPIGLARLALQWLLTRRGPFAMNVNQAGGFFRGRPDRERANLQLYFNPLSYRIPDDPKAGLAPEPYPGFLLCFNPGRAPTMMVAEKGAAMIVEDQGL
ncbi:GMC family oxidoreductase [Aureimonas sp. SK2]|uniref:GMC family oxidoreductase n=1 Tax=Aureimonas sp. SK2 TaxID=3015992 RepID=UPI00387E7C5D